MDAAQRAMPAGPLPVEAVPLIGRDELLQATCTLLRDDAVRLLTLTGPAGGGKTRLALAAARAQAARLRHGVRFVDLAPVRDPAMVIPAIAAALGVREAGERSLPARVHRALRDRHVLLVLDNFEQVLPAAPRVGELLSACPGVRALVTSRAALHLRWEHEMAVPPLAIPDLAHLPPPDELASIPAVALFLYRARTVQREFALDAANAAPVAEVCARLDGLPLAIELAAARVKVLPPAALLARLEHRLGLLVGGGPDRPTRHQTLRAALDWSHDLLDPRQRALLRRLAVFSGGFTLAAAEAVCADQTGGDSTDDGGAEDGGRRPDDPAAPAAPAAPGRAPAVVWRDDVLDALEALVNNSLVRPAQVVGGEPRYALLETVREYAAERLAASGEAGRLNGRHTAYFLALAEAGAGALRGAAQAEWLSRLDREHGNLRAALSRGLPATGAVDGKGEGFAGEQGTQAVGPGAPADAAAGLRLAGALAPFWRIRGHLSEGQRWLERLLAGAPAGPLAVRARALLGAGELAQAGADWVQARPWLEEGLALSRQVGDAGLIGRTARALGQALLDAGEVAASRPLLEEGVVRLRGAGGPGDLGDALLGLATLAQAGGDLRQTRALLEEALEVGQRDGDGTIVATARYDLGRILMFRGERALARAQLEEGLRVAEALGSPLLLMKLHRWLGSMATQDGDAAGSERHLQASLSHAREADDLSGVAYALAALGELALRVGDPQAVPLLEESRRRFTELRFPWGQGRALRGLATAAHRRGDAPAALALLREELALWRDLDDGLGVAGGLERVARVLVGQGQTAASARLTGAAVAIRERLGAAGPDGQPLEAISAAHAGDTAWQAAYVAGRALTQAEAVAEALALALVAGDEAGAAGGTATPTAGAAALPFDLTPREAEVLQLLAEGASDAEIAERLIISVRTVNRHVANILGKTGAPNRTAAASLALRQRFS